MRGVEIVSFGQEAAHEFAVRLKRLREGRRMNRRVLSECCGVSKNMISRYERGEQIPSIDTAAEIADFFGVSLDYLCGRQKNF